MAATITFRGKPEKVYSMDGTLAYERIKVPKLRRSHFDMPAFRKHPKIGPYTNSDLFANFIMRELKALGVKEYIRLDNIPEGVEINTNSFLAEVTISIV